MRIVLPRRAGVVRVAASCAVLAAMTAGCGSGTKASDASPGLGRTTTAAGPSWAAQVNELCSDLLVKVKEVNGGGGHPGHFPIKEYLAEQPQLAALTTAFDAKVAALPVTAGDQEQTTALHAFQAMSDRATAMLDAAAATGAQAKFDEAFGAVHRMFDDSTVADDLLTQGIACNGR